MEKEFKEIISHFQRSKRKLWSQEAAKWADIFLWRQETRDKTWTGYSCCSFLWNFVCKAFASIFFSWPHYLSLGLLVWELIGIFWVWEFTGKLIKAALFVWGAVKWRYYTLLPDIVIVISEQGNLRCTWLTELSKGNWSKPAQSRFI